MATEVVQHRLVAIVFTDVVGSTAVAARSEADGLRLRDRHRELVRTWTARYQGRLIEAPGDESLSTFESALDAVSCALALRGALQDEPELRVRVGIHLGETMFRGEEVFGDGVNIAARVQAEAEPGEILVSGEVAHALRSQPGLEASPRGQHELRGVQRPIDLYAITGAGAEPPPRWRGKVRSPERLSRVGAVAATLLAVAFVLAWWLSRLPPPPGPIRSIAVLPLENLSADAGQAYLADGMTQALIGALAGIGSLRVISRTSVMQYKGVRGPLGEIAKALNVDGVVEGSVIREGERIRIAAQLIDARSDVLVWAEGFDRDLRSVLEIQASVAQAIARAIELSLTPEEATRLARPRAVDHDPKTYETYLKGMYHLHQSTPEGVAKGLAHLRRAIASDPGDPLAYAGLALAYNDIGHDPGAPSEAAQGGEAMALTALELDDTLAEAWAALAQSRQYFQWDWGGAEQAYRRALELNPNLAATRAHHGWYLVLLGREEEALAEDRRARELDPLNPVWGAFLSNMYWWYGHHDEALAEAQKLLEVSPEHPYGLYMLGTSYQAKGRYDDAIAAHRKAASSNPHWGWGLAHVYAELGRTDEARGIAAEMARAERPNAWGLAEVYTALGDADEALRWVRLATEDRHLSPPWAPWMGSNPNLAPLRDDPRFRELLRRFGLPAG